MLLASFAVVSTDIPPAYSVEYPTWGDVVAARQSEQATQAEIARIQVILDSLRAEAAQTEADAAATVDAYRIADQSFQEGAAKSAELSEQADAAEQLAASSRQQAGEIIAQQYRAGSSVDVTTSLLVNSAAADDMLYSFGLADKLSERVAEVYTKAIQDQNTAQALTDQAQVAEAKLEELKDVSEGAFIAAQQAVAAAAAAVDEREENEAELEAQLTVLTERRQVTEADYTTGEQVRAAAAAAAAQAGAAAAAAAAAHPPTHGTPLAGTSAQSGWAKPISGGITSGYGNRLNPYSKVWRLHAGTDVGAGFGTPIYAAHGGTVVYAGSNGMYGNFVLIDNGDGTSTA